ncbi:hypothetical protein [Flavobacterium algicola]|uniref:hypothetical protein n=1 Tax=Flavobacterium algicola TaxID=556529 RepID=UPI001EFC5FF3|nr:hypothetical protein [Flavobacterium algicola]MCG9792500.1 hypothetical protein [Flavobacterium algicola]
MKNFKNLKKQLAFTILLLIASLSLQAQQLRFKDQDEFNLGISTESIEIEYQNAMYIRAGVGINKMIGAAGINLTTGLFNNVRYYVGGRLGFTYTREPIAGFELGTDFTVSDTFTIGLRGMRDNGDLKAAFKIAFIL